MPTTPTWDLPYPTTADSPHGPSQFEALAVAVEAALGALVPIGTVVSTATASAPAGWLLCQGQAVSRTTYATLYAALGGASSPYGQGDGSTTFNLPDLRGRVIVSEDGTAGRLTANDALGQSGGAEKHTLTATEMPSHTHSDGTLAAAAAGAHAHNGSTTQAIPSQVAGVTQGVPQGGGVAGVSGVTNSGVANYNVSPHTHNLTTDTEPAHSHDVTGATGSAGSSGAHNNMQPYQVLNHMIRAK